MNAKTFRYFLVTIILLLLVVGAFIFVKISQEEPPKLLNIDDQNETFTIITDGNICMVSGEPNELGVTNVFAASNNVDLKQYIGEKVKIKGQFIFSLIEAVKDCKIAYRKGPFSSGRVVLEVTEVIPQGNIIVSSPQQNEQVGKTFIVTGEARVFENTFQVRLTNPTTQEILFNEPAMADAKDVGLYGPFSVPVDLSAANLQPGQELLLEVFQFSAKDGTEVDKVSVPLQL